MGNHVRPNIGKDGYKFDFERLDNREQELARKRKITRNKNKITNVEFI